MDGGYSVDGYRNPQFYAKRMEKKSKRRQRKVERRRVLRRGRLYPAPPFSWEWKRNKPRQDSWEDLLAR